MRDGEIQIFIPVGFSTEALCKHLRELADFLPEFDNQEKVSEVEAALDREAELDS